MSNNNFMEARRQFSDGALSTGLFILVLIISNATTLFSQRQMTLGALNNVPQLNLINPANTPDSKWYIGIPLLSGINGSYRNSSFTPAQLGFGSSNVPDYFKAMDFADTLNNAYGELYVEDLAFGINFGKSFFSFSMGEKIIARTEYPGELIQWLGYEQENVDIPLGNVFDLGDFNFSATHYREIALGAGRKLFNDKLTLAGRAKLLLGQASVQSDNYNLRLWHRPDQDYNYEITGRMDILASGFDRFGEGKSPYQLFGKANMGVAFDLGAQLKVGKATFFASVTDLGKIKWTKNNSYTAIKDIAVDGQTMFDTAIDELAKDRGTGAKPFNTELVTKIYGGGQFTIGESHTVSVMVNPRLYLGETEMNGSIAYRLRTSKFLDLIASYNFIEGRSNNIGFGATVNLNPVQLYFVTDRAQSVFKRNDQQDFHFAAGINLLFGRPKEKVVAGNDNDGMIPVEDLMGSGSFNTDQKISAVTNATRKNPKTEPAPEQAPKADKETGVVEKYFTFYGTVIDDESDEPLDAIHVDVYAVGENNERELIHTSRYPGHTFNVPLYQNHLKHEISVGGYGYSRQTLSFKTDRDRLEYEFRMSDGLWTSDTTEEYVDDPGQVVKLVSAEEPAEDLEAREKAKMFRYHIERSRAEIQLESLAATDTDGVFEIIQRTSLRQEPDAQARVMKRLGVGTNLILLERTDKYWWKMKLGDQIGYVKQRLLVGVQ